MNLKLGQETESAKEQNSKIRLPSISLLAQSLPPRAHSQTYETRPERGPSSEALALSKSPFEDVNHRPVMESSSPPQNPNTQFQDAKHQGYYSPSTRYHYKGDYSQHAQYHGPYMLSREEFHRHHPQQPPQHPQPIPQQLQHPVPPPRPSVVGPFPQSPVYYAEQIPTNYPHVFASTNSYVTKSSRRSKASDRKVKPRLYCQRCGITDTPEWRKGPNGARTLCNACGLYHAKILKREGPEAAAAAVLKDDKIAKEPVQRRPSYGVPEYPPPKAAFEMNYQIHSPPVHIMPGYFDPQHGNVQYAYPPELVPTVSYPPHMKVTHRVPYYPTSDPNYHPIYSQVSSPISDRERGK